MLCKTCSVGEPYKASDWFNHIWFLFELQRGGYPFEKNDLTIDEWIDLGLIRTEMEMPINYV